MCCTYDALAVGGQLVLPMTLAFFLLLQLVLFVVLCFVGAVLVVCRNPKVSVSIACSVHQGCVRGGSELGGGMQHIHNACLKRECIASKHSPSILCST